MKRKKKSITTVAGDWLEIDGNDGSFTVTGSDGKVKLTGRLRVKKMTSKLDASEPVPAERSGTRFYLPSTLTKPPVAPNPDAGWEDTSNMKRGMMIRDEEPE